MGQMGRARITRPVLQDSVLDLTLCFMKPLVETVTEEKKRKKRESEEYKCIHRLL